MAANTQIDALAFRATLGTFVTGVTIITAAAPNGSPVGLTVNSFNSVSLDPPMVLWSVSKLARSYPVFRETRAWAVHVLSAAQEELSVRFAARDAERFRDLELEEGFHGVPLLTGCVARLQCRTVFEYEGGDHMILVGEVVAFDRTENDPLLVHEGRYALAVRKGPEQSRPGAGEFYADFTEDFLGYLLCRAHFGFYERVSRHAARYGIDDAGLFILLQLRLRDGSTLAAMNDILSQHGQWAGPTVLEKLTAMGLVRAVTSPCGHLCYLTRESRELTLRIAADLKAIEADVLGHLGGAEAVLLKRSLRNLIAALSEDATDAKGQPHEETKWAP